MGLPEVGGGLRQVVEAVGEGRAGGMGYAAAGKQLPAAGLAAPVAQGRVGAQQGHLQPLRQLPLQIAHHKAVDEAAPWPQQLGNAGQQGRPLQQLGGEGPAGGVVGIEQVQPPPRMGGGQARQQLQHRIHHQLPQGLAGGVNHAHPRIPQSHQGEQLPLLVVVGPGHQVDLALVHRQRRHHQHIHIRPLGLGGVAPFGLQLALELAEAEQGHGGIRRCRPCGPGSGRGFDGAASASTPARRHGSAVLVRPG